MKMIIKLITFVFSLVAFLHGVSGAGANCYPCPGLTYDECSGSQGHPGAGVSGQDTGAITLVHDCTDYTYNGYERKAYKYSGTGPIDIIITGLKLDAGEKAQISQFTCTSGVCKKAVIDHNATTPLPLSKGDDRRRFIISESSKLPSKTITVKFKIIAHDSNCCPAGNTGDFCSDNCPCKGKNQCDAETKRCKILKVCATYPTYPGGHQLRAKKGPKDRAQARADCAADGGFLVTIKTKSVEDAIPQAKAADGVTGKTYNGLKWISPGVFTWDDNPAIQYTINLTNGLFTNGQYSNWWIFGSWDGLPGSQHCFINFSSLEWEDEYCTKKHGYICQC